MTAAAGDLHPYVPTLLREWLRSTPDTLWRSYDGTLVLVDISGFTRLSERLSRAGRVGAEELTDAIDSCFTALLEVAYRRQGSLLKFGGDALLLFFSGDDHLTRACRAAVGMRERLRDVGHLDTSAGQVTLRMSVGIHTGTTDIFVVGGSHRELIVTGPAATQVVAAETAASAGEIVVSAATAASLPDRSTAPGPGGAYLLRSDLPDALDGPPQLATSSATHDLLPAIPTGLRQQVLAEQHDAEHRLVSVAFLRFGDVDQQLAEVGASAIAEMLDGLVRAVQVAADRRDITFLGSDIDGDGGKILLAAGAPSSHGNDEELMLLALRDIAVVDTSLSIRMGVNAGYVFAGDIGPPYRRTYTVMGDAVNLAARVMGRAGPGQVVATSGVVAASRTVFETTELEPFQVKGKRDPVVASLIGASSGSRADVERDGLPLVGRDAELVTFDEVLATTLGGGTGRSIEVTGEAGIGKTRLLQAFRDRASSAVLVHDLVCELHRATTPYGAIRKLLRRLLDVPADATEGEAAELLLAKLRADVPELLEWAPLIAIALGTELPPTRTTATLDDRFVRPRLHEALVELLAWRWDGPVVVTIEDAQWLDEASLDVVRAIAAETERRPWVLVTARRRADEEAAGPGSVLRMDLAPLDDDALEALVRTATDAAPLTSHDSVLLVERSGGNPLFLQELVAAAAEAGGVEALPDSVGSLVTARIDRLPPAQRSVLREVSVLGHSFPRDLAAAVLTSGDPSDLDELTDFLVDAGDSVRFRHAIIREVAYEGLPYRRRRRLHAAAGDTIAAARGDQPELLSLHYHLAGRYRDALSASRRAGDDAAAVYANVDAARFYERALEASRRLDDPDPAEIAQVSEALGDTLQRLGDAARAGEAYRQAATGLRDDPVSWARIQLKQARVKAHLKRYSQALAAITRALRQLDGLDDAAAQAQRAHLFVWYAHFRLEQGRHADAIVWSRHAIAAAEDVDERAALGHAYRLLDWAYVDSGEPELATHSNRAIALYEELGDLPSLATVHNNLGGIAYWLGDWDEAREHYARANELDERTGDVLGAALGRNNLAEILSDQGRWEEAERLFRDADRAVRAARFLSAIAYVRGNLGRTLGRLGRHDEAHQLLLGARDGAREVGANTQVVEAEARIAELYVLRGQPDDALGIIDDALRRADAAEGVAAQEPLLHRLRGYALRQQGRFAAAREALELSLAAARARDADYERALTERALADLAEAVTGEQDRELLDSSQATFDRLGVERLPRFPESAAAVGD